MSIFAVQHTPSRTHQARPPLCPTNKRKTTCWAVVVPHPLECSNTWCVTASNTPTIRQSDRVTTLTSGGFWFDFKISKPASAPENAAKNDTNYDGWVTRVDASPAQRQVGLTRLDGTNYKDVQAAKRQATDCPVPSPSPVQCRTTLVFAKFVRSHVKDLQTLRLLGLRFGVTGSSSIPRQALHNHSPVLGPNFPTRSSSVNL